MKITGNCFQIAAILIMDNKYTHPQLPDAVLVHALVTRHFDGKRHCHAFIEWADGRLVEDQSNGIDLTVKKETYYKAGKIVEKELVRYTYRETLKNLTSTGHYGPWAKIFDNY